MHTFDVIIIMPACKKLNIKHKLLLAKNKTVLNIMILINTPQKQHNT